MWLVFAVFIQNTLFYLVTSEGIVHDNFVEFCCSGIMLYAAIDCRKHRQLLPTKFDHPGQAHTCPSQVFYTIMILRFVNSKKGHLTLKTMIKRGRTFIQNGELISRNYFEKTVVPFLRIFFSFTHFKIFLKIVFEKIRVWKKEEKFWKNWKMMAKHFSQSNLCQ